MARDLESLLDTEQSRLDLQHILTGFHNQKIHISGDQTFRLLAKGSLHRVEVDMTECRQLGGGPDRTGHEAGLLGSAVKISHFPR